MSSIYIRLNHIGPTWTTTSPEALALLPDGYAYSLAGTDGAWAEPVEPPPLPTIALTLTDPTIEIPAGWCCVCRTKDGSVREIVPATDAMSRAVREYREGMRGALRSEGGLSEFFRRADEMWLRAGGTGPRPLIAL